MKIGPFDYLCTNTTLRMKTFILNIPNHLRLKDQELDAKAALCEKPWVVFNDEGKKQLFIFQTDGTLLITTNGVVSRSTWQFISANSSVIIANDGNSIMFHPTFHDDVVFALEQDGANSCLFMIDERNKESFAPSTLLELGNYFSKKEQLLIAEDNKKNDAIRIKTERREQRRIEEEEKRLKERETRIMEAAEEAREQAVLEQEKELLRKRKDVLKEQYSHEIEEIRARAKRFNTKMWWYCLPPAVVCVVFLFCALVFEYYKTTFLVVFLISLITCIIIREILDFDENEEIDKFLNKKILEEDKNQKSI